MDIFKLSKINTSKTFKAFIKCFVICGLITFVFQISDTVITKFKEGTNSTTPENTTYP